MGKAMLAVLCLIPLVLCVGAESPPVTTNTTRLLGMIDKFENFLVQKLNSWKEEEQSAIDQYSEGIAQSEELKTTSRTPNESKVLIWVYDRYIEFIERVTDFFREIALKTSASPSHESPEGNIQYAARSANEKDSKESEAFSTPSCESEDCNHSRTGTIRAIPGFHFPEYRDIPDTSFDCSSKAYIPGMYADTETGCQVFHVCWPHKKESFLCPIGTTFNQAILTCDFWYTSDCALASSYYDVNVQTDWTKLSKIESVMDLLGKEHPESVSSTEDFPKLKDSDLAYISEMLPVKAKVVVFRKPRDIGSKIVETSLDGEIKARENLQVTEELSEILEQELLGTTKLPLTLRSREPRSEGDGVELHTTKLPLLTVPRIPRSEGDGVELGGTTTLPLLTIPRRPRAEVNIEAESNTQEDLKITEESSVETSEPEVADTIELSLHSGSRKRRAHQGISTTFSILHEVLGLVKNILQETERIYFTINDAKSQPSRVRIPTYATSRNQAE